MSNRTIISIVTAGVVILLVLAIIYPLPMISPGRLIDGHAELETDCFACHTPLIGSRSAKCVECHKVADIGLKDTKGVAIVKQKKSVAFHQELSEEDCVSCHSDHKGVATFRPINQFSHNLLKPKLQKQCDSCHSNPEDELHRQIKGNCGGCHTQNAWTPATFEHEKYFRFDRHHTTECITCHLDNNYSNYTCYECHEHSRLNIWGEHVEEGIRDFDNCVECHRSGDEHEAERIWRSKGRSQGYRGDDDDHHDHDDDD